MREIVELTDSEFKPIYRQYLRKDFPFMECRPWFSIQRAFRQGCYTAYGYKEDTQLLAYASLMAGEGSPYRLLDYYAVLPDRRGQGIGSAFLTALTSAVSGMDGIFIEAENPAFARDTKEKQTRQRRLSFYQHGGARLTGVSTRLFRVEYTILYVPVEKELKSRDAYADGIRHLYRAIYHPIHGKVYTDT